MAFKITLPLLISLIGVNSLADYTIVYPVKYVTFKNIVKWEATDPQYSDWINSGSPSNCKIQTPLENTMPAGQGYEKSFSKCDINQERTVTQYLVRKDTGETKPNGTSQETRVFSDYSYKAQSVGTMPTEECRYSMSGKNFHWYDVSRAVGATDGKGSVLTWDGVQVKTTMGVGGGNQPTEFVVGSYKYKRSTFQYKSLYNDSLWYHYYQICRTAI
jgi:hypothetical protein